MEGYLGETELKVQDTPYKGYKPKDWALLYIFKYGQIDGSHHKTWVLDQVARILNGAPVLIKEARWDNGQIEHRFDVGTSAAYEKWVQKMKYDEEGEEYDYDEGTPP